MSPTCSSEQRSPLLVPNATRSHHIFLLGAVVGNVGASET